MSIPSRGGGGDTAAGVGAAEGPGVDSRLGGHATPSQVDGAATRTPEHEKEHQAGLRRLGMNDLKAMEALKHQWGSVDARSPMLVVPFLDFERHGKLPRSNDPVLKKGLSDLDLDDKIVFISHRWFLPWQSLEELHKFLLTASPEERASAMDDEEEVRAYYSTQGPQENKAHPDDASNSKHKLVCAATRKIAEEKGWDLSKVFLWLDYFCIDQEDLTRKLAGVRSLRGYVSVCNVVVVPSKHQPEEAAYTVNRVPGGYGDRAWTRLEAFVWYTLSHLKQEETPELWVAAGPGACYLKKFQFVLDPDKMASVGLLFLEADRADIKVHEDKILTDIKEATKRQGYITKHGSNVHCVAFHPTESGLVASCCGDGKIKLVDRGTGTLRKEFVGHEGGVWSIAFNSDGSKLVSGGGDKTVRIWDVATGKEMMGPLSGHSGWVLSVAFSPDGTTVVSGSEDTTVKLWDVESGEEKCSLTGHSDRVASVAFSPDGKLVASGSWDATVKIWDVSGPTPSEKCSLTGHSDYVRSVAFSPDGTTVASGSDDTTVKVWDVESGEEKCSLTGHSDFVRSVAFSPDGKLVASGSDDRTVKIWDVENGGTEKCSLTGHSADVSSVAFSPDGKLVVSASHDETVKIWDVENGGTEKCSLTGHSKGVRSVAFSPDGKTVVSGSYDETVKLWDVASGAVKCSLTGHSDCVTSVAFSPDGKLVVSGSWDNTVKLWDVESGEEKCSLRGHSASWVDVGPEIRALGELVEQEGSGQRFLAGEYIVTADGDKVHLYRVPPGRNSGAQQDAEPVASFRSPSRVRAVVCRPPIVCAGCAGGQVLFLEAPLLSAGSGD